MTWQVGVVGYGAIGSVVADRLGVGEVAGAALACVVVRNAGRDLPAPAASLEDAITGCDLLIEAAGQAFVRDHAEAVLTGGSDLLLASVGALADAELHRKLVTGGPGRLVLTAGAVGGLDMLAAARRAGPLHRVELRSTKRATTLIQPWMDEATRQRLSSTTEPVEAFRGSAVEAAARFPKSANVAMAVAIAAGTRDVEVTMMGDPDVTATRHEIRASGPYGCYRFEVQNQPDADNRATSRIVPFAMLRSVAAIVGGEGGLML